jgi:hypothetical protein
MSSARLILHPAGANPEIIGKDFCQLLRTKADELPPPGIVRANGRHDVPGLCWEFELPAVFIHNSRQRSQAAPQDD